MTFRKRLLYLIIQFKRFILKRKFLRIHTGPLKGYSWSTSYNYDYFIGDYEAEKTMQLFFSWLNPSTVFYDLGANVGFFSILASKYISNGMIYSFEPIPYNVVVFKQHLELNKSQINQRNIELLPYAITDKEGEVAMTHDRYAIEGNTYIASAYLATTDRIMVECHSIDGLLEAGYLKPDVIKIDVEGAELDVLKGAERTLATYKPNILLATHDCHLPGVKQNCIRFLELLGYRVTALPSHNKHVEGLDDFIAIHEQNLERYDAA